MKEYYIQKITFIEDFVNNKGEPFDTKEIEINLDLTSDTLDGLFQKLELKLGIQSTENVEWDSEPSEGLFFYSCMSKYVVNKNCMREKRPCTKEDLELWKKGDINLWKVMGFVKVMTIAPYEELCDFSDKLKGDFHSQAICE